MASLRGWSRPGGVAALAAAAAVFVAGVAVLTGSRSADGSAAQVRLTSPAKDAFGISLPSTSAGESYTIGAIPLCLTSPGSATIESVQVTGSRGALTVDAFAVRPLSANMFGAERITLATTGFGRSHQVTGACSRAPGGAELAVQLSKGEPGNGRGSGLAVRWRSTSGSGTVVIPAHIVLCQGADQDVAQCQAL